MSSGTVYVFKDTFILAQLNKKFHFLPWYIKNTQLHTWNINKKKW